MTQLNRIEPGKDVEEAHMRNRQLIAAWILDKGKKDKVVELVKKKGKTYVKINDYKKMRSLVGDLLKEIQRIRSFIKRSFSDSRLSISPLTGASSIRFMCLYMMRTARSLT